MKRSTKIEIYLKYVMHLDYVTNFLVTDVSSEPPVLKSGRIVSQGRELYNYHTQWTKRDVLTKGA